MSEQPLRIRHRIRDRSRGSEGGSLSTSDHALDDEHTDGEVGSIDGRRSFPTGEHAVTAPSASSAGHSLASLSIMPQTVDVAGPTGGRRSLENTAQAERATADEATPVSGMSGQADEALNRSMSAALQRATVIDASGVGHEEDDSAITTDASGVLHDAAGNVVTLRASDGAYVEDGGASGGGPQATSSTDTTAQSSQPTTSTDTTADGESDTPAGAPPDIQEEFDPAPEDDNAQSDDAVIQASLQRAIDPVPSIQRQAGGSASGVAAPAPPQVVAKVLQWSDFPPLPNRQGGMSAKTGFRETWHNDGTGFNVVFNRGTSWSVVADQTPALLQHEQYHLNLAVLMANKANAVAAAGTMKAKALISAFKKAISTHTVSYDGDTNHGTNAAMQAKWVADIDAGVPEFPIT